jgi:hypothetical protein
VRNRKLTITKQKLGTNGFTFADLDVNIPEVWGSQINDYFRYNLKLASFFVDRSDELADGGDTIYTPNLSALSVNVKTNNAEVTLSSPTYTTQTLVVSTWKESSFVIEDREMAQLKKSYYLQSKIAEGGAYEVAQDLDDAIAALFSGFSTAVGASTTNLADSNLLAAIATLESAGVPGIYTGDVAFILHPNTFYRQIGTIDKFTLWQNTKSEEPRMKAPTPMLYGIPVIVTPAVGTSLGSRLNVLAHKDAIHWARLSMPAKAEKGFVGGEGVRVQQSYVHEYLGELVTIDLCYGVVENRDTAAVLLKSHATVA